MVRSSGADHRIGPVRLRSPTVIVVCGEALIDLTSSRTETGRFDAHPGGGPCNTAVGLGRLGISTGFLGRLSTDRFGASLRRHLAAAIVDLSMVTDTDDLSTLAVANLDVSGGAAYTFYANGTADPGLTAEMLLPLGQTVRALHMGYVFAGLRTIRINSRSAVPSRARQWNPFSRPRSQRAHRSGE